MSSFSIRRLNKELESFIKDPSPEYTASPIKDDLYCWHFTIRGPSDTSFENGIYHGVIKLPYSYPNKPPNIMFLTPSGRFEVNSNICLSITKFHTEEWQSAWTIRSMLEAIIAFMPVHEDHDAIGAMDTSEEARKKYAIMSRNFVCDVCGPIVDLLPEKKEKNLNDEKNNDDINIKEENNNDEFKFKNSKSEQINYTEIFKKIRQSQYSKINEENKKNEINDNNNNNEEEEENEEEFNEKNNKINNLNNLLNMNKKEKINPLLEEELEFFEIQKSIKFHENENKNEIEDNFINNKKNKNINKKILKNLTDEKIELLKVNKQQLEKFFKKQINFLKYYSKKTYEETRSKTLKNFNIIMTCIILFIFFSYWIITKLNIKISKYSKIKSSL